MSWTGTARARWWWTLAGWVALWGVVLAVTGTLLVGLGLVVMAIVIGVFFQEVRVTVDEAGLRARMGRIGWPAVTIPLADITAADVVNVRPMAWGWTSGWGYRGSLTLLRRAAWVVRAGPGIELEMTARRRFTVTVDEPEVGVEALRANLRRRG